MLVVDFQVGVVRGCFDAAGVLARTRSLVDRARAEGAAVVWIQDESDFPHDSDDWRLAPPLAPEPEEARVFKSYRDAFEMTELPAILDRLGAARLLVVGSQSDYCVRTTAVRGAAERYDVTLVSDCHTTCDQELEGVTISGEQAVAHTNLYFRDLRYPGGRFGIAKHDEVALSATER